ncbi:MAG: hypothetical protein JG765_2543 [Cereibacter sp.]|jgi:ABC-type enterobactin transport system permease subunit|nr:hypothetical protein [Cereibacter sp.]
MAASPVTGGNAGRIWAALLSGAAFGLFALVFQQVLRNQPAEAAILGVLSGGQAGMPCRFRRRRICVASGLT